MRHGAILAWPEERLPTLTGSGQSVSFTVSVRAHAVREGRFHGSPSWRWSGGISGGRQEADAGASPPLHCPGTLISLPKCIEHAHREQYRSPTRASRACITPAWSLGTGSTLGVVAHF